MADLNFRPALHRLKEEFHRALRCLRCVEWAEAQSHPKRIFRRRIKHQSGLASGQGARRGGCLVNKTQRLLSRANDDEAALQIAQIGTRLPFKRPFPIHPHHFSRAGDGENEAQKEERDGGNFHGR